MQVGCLAFAALVLAQHTRIHDDARDKRLTLRALVRKKADPSHPSLVSAAR